MATLLDFIKDEQSQKAMRNGLLDAANRGVVAGLLGSPVDIATMALRPLGYSVEKPTGGSEWIGQKMQDAGLVSDQRNPIAEALAGVAVPGAAVKAARWLSALSDMSPSLVGSPGGYLSTPNQIGAMSPEGIKLVQADLLAGKGSESYRMGDVTPGQIKNLQEYGLPKSQTNDVMMTKDIMDHIIKGRIKEDGFTPDEVLRFMKEAMARRSAADPNVTRDAKNPALIQRGLTDPATGRTYSATMPFKSDGEVLHPVTIIPKGLDGPNKKAPKK